MKVVAATCFESNEERLGFVVDTCLGRGDEVKAYSSDFSHIRKMKRDSFPSFLTPLAAAPYKKNLSLSRILSHMRFAKDLFDHIEADDPDLIWLMAPANSLIREAKKYKARHPEKKLVIDIIDMWPESLPVNINKNILPFRMWRNIRKNNIGCCNALVSECDLYQAILKEEYPGKITTLRWAREGRAIPSEGNRDDSKLVLCYIGSINNIIDAEKIADVIASFDMPVVLHVIGEGESTEQFLEMTKKVSELIYHGPIRDEEEKKKIFDLCHAGINIYRENLYIGLTVKCIDYFRHGLPIINNIKGDTSEFVKKYHAGVNIGEEKIDAKKLIDMRNHNASIYDLFNENLSKDVFLATCNRVIDEVMK